MLYRNRQVDKVFNYTVLNCSYYIAIQPNNIYPPSAASSGLVLNLGSCGYKEYYTMI